MRTDHDQVGQRQVFAGLQSRGLVGNGDGKGKEREGILATLISISRLTMYVQYLHVIIESACSNLHNTECTQFSGSFPFGKLLW